MIISDLVAAMFMLGWPHTFPARQRRQGSASLIVLMYDLGEKVSPPPPCHLRATERCTPGSYRPSAVPLGIGFWPRSRGALQATLRTGRPCVSLKHTELAVRKTALLARQR